MIAVTRTIEGTERKEIYHRLGVKHTSIEVRNREGVLIEEHITMEE